MRQTELTFLTALIELAHGKCSCEKLVTVKHIYRDLTLWEGEVAVFELQHHESANRCFAWIADDNSSPRPIMLLNSPSIHSAAEAVREHFNLSYRQIAA